MGEEAFLEEIRAQYNAPGTPPAEAMWKNVERGLDRPAVGRRVGRAFDGAWLRIAAGVLLLLTGVGIGRFSAQTSAPSTAALGGEVSWGEDESSEQLLPTFAHLREADLLLSILTDEGGDGRMREQSSYWAQSLLLETAILKRLHGESDPEIAALLGELESILALVAGLATREAGGAGPDAHGTLARTLEDGTLRTRIHALLPGKAS